MIFRFRHSNINEGQLRLMTMIAGKYNVTLESIINQLILDYNKMHINILISKSVYDTTLGVSFGVVEVGDALAKKSYEDWIMSMKPDSKQTVKIAKHKQIKTIEESL